MTTVAEFALALDPQPWRAVGFSVDSDGAMQLGGIRLRFVGVAHEGNATPEGIISWMLADAPDQTVQQIDGLRTAHGEPPDSVTPHQQPNGVAGIDHVVIYTPDLECTCDAIAIATGAPLKRIREVGQLRQGFHRLGELIVEVVTFPGVPVEHATFWGLALNVRDIDALFAAYGGDVLSPPKDAVQPGRRIASFSDAALLGLPVALMTTFAP